MRTLADWDELPEVETSQTTVRLEREDAGWMLPNGESVDADVIDEVLRAAELMGLRSVGDEIRAVICLQGEYRDVRWVEFRGNGRTVPASVNATRFIESEWSDFFGE